MGFLDRMIGDLVEDATGFRARHVRSLVRSVGLKNILMVGGAAIAGGAAATQASRTGSPGGSPQPATQRVAPPPPSLPLPPSPGPTTAAPPPSLPSLPPIPGGAPPPDLPPLPLGGDSDTKEADLSPEASFAIARTLVAAAMSDGQLADKERQAVLDNLESSDLSAEQKSQVQADLADPPSPESLSFLAQSDDEREALYRFAALMVAADGVIEEAESDWLDRFARALGLSPARVRNLSS